MILKCDVFNGQQSYGAMFFWARQCSRYVTFLRRTLVQ